MAKSLVNITTQQEFDKAAGHRKSLFNAICSVLADSPRPGSPCTFTTEQICQIIAVACETPPAPLTHWTRNDLVRAVIARGIVKTLSASTMGRLLKEGDLKPYSDHVIMLGRKALPNTRLT